MTLLNNLQGFRNNIIGLPDRLRISQIGADNNVFTVSVNPESYSISHKYCYDNIHSMESSELAVTFTKAVLQNMTLDLLFDSTGSLGKTPFVQNETVLDQINRFLSITRSFPDPKKKTGEKEKTKKLRLIWGEMEFHGFLETVTITYSHFDSTGMPIRAKAHCTFIGGEPKVEETEPSFEPAPEIQTPINASNEKHPVNELSKYGGYIKAVSIQTNESMPNSLRLTDEINKMVSKA